MKQHTTTLHNTGVCDTVDSRQRPEPEAQMASTWGHIVTKVQTRVEIVLSAFLPPMSLMELHTSVSHGTAHVRKRVDPELLCISGQPPPPLLPPLFKC
mmetsp:Transcript_45479/g.74286  ORF Transcript_45479/g.74286 Transcript_45479/m.74286 type:complete len:98 (+) Transcript_45479:250-543(+)